MVVKVSVRGRPNYWRFTVYSWLLEVRDILEQELGEPVEVVSEDGDSEDPEVYLDGHLVGVGVPGEEGYLIEVIKKAALELKAVSVFIITYLISCFGVSSLALF